MDAGEKHNRMLRAEVTIKGLIFVYHFKLLLKLSFEADRGENVEFDARKWT